VTAKAELDLMIDMLDELPDNATDEAARLLRTLRDSLMQALFAAPEDDTPRPRKKPPAPPRHASSTDAVQGGRGKTCAASCSAPDSNA
jgi:hypothetical protein